MRPEGKEMERESLKYRTYIKILERELVPAMGCTEPIAIAFCAATARKTLGARPTAIRVEASGNIIKNVKSVIVPNTGGKHGIEAAAAAGVLYGDAEAGLQVFAHAAPEEIEGLDAYMQETEICVANIDFGYVLDIIVTVSDGVHTAKAHTALEHTNLVRIEKDGAVLFEKPIVEETDPNMPDYELLNVRDILDFAKSCDLEDVLPVLKRQIAYNVKISDEGLNNPYGSNIGKTLMQVYGDENVRIRAKARAAAGSDARMNGCDLPVVINSGSGNQGMTVSLPVYEYARALRAPEEAMWRALLVSNLVTLHEKEGIGRLSAYCGAVSAGAGAGAGIAWLKTGGDVQAVEQTIVNALAITSGIVCDGAKASCAAKIATAVDAGILGFEMYRNGRSFRGGDGLVAENVEHTISNISRLGREGMKGTDKEIIDIMISR